MLAKATYHPFRSFLICRIYKFLLAVIIVIAHWQDLLSQEVGAYKTVQNGIFSNPLTWNVFDGSIWIPASVKPNLLNDIYIDQTHTLILTSNESAKNIFINSETGAGQKLNLNGFSLEVYGSLNAFSGPAPGTPTGTWNSQNWIGNSISSKLIFRGNSRVIIPANAWSGFTTNSRYSVEFDPGPGIILQVNETFKALKFTIKSGTVLQTIDTSVIPNTCASFSFNNEAMFGSGSFGDFIIENGGTLISQCNSGILFRSGTSGTPNSASTFIIEDGGELILEGESPKIEAATFQLDGKVIFRNYTNPQSFLGSTYTGSVTPDTFHDLEIQGSQNLSFPSYLNISGDITQNGTGTFLANSTEIEFSGDEHQSVEGFPMIVGNLTLNKVSSSVSFEQDLIVLNDLEMISGQIDLQNNDLSINTSLTGELKYTSGSWSNVNNFTYFGVPTTLDATNGTFPFADRYHGGIRKIQMLGTSAGGNLQINFTEYQGAEYNSSFSDNDATQILYRLFSYFQFSGLNPSPNPLELRISADKLIVDQVDDLRIVGTGYAAPGTHLPGLDPGLWARRTLTFDDLAGVNFTVGSYRTLSILPIIWRNVTVNWKNGLPNIKWEMEGLNEWSVLDILRIHGTDTTKILLKSMPYPFPNPGEYVDSLPLPHGETYYQLRLTDSHGITYSSAVRLPKSKEFQEMLFPNPSQTQEKLYLKLPAEALNSPIQIFGMDGKLILESKYENIEISSLTEGLGTGYYILRVIGKDQVFVFKLIRN
jgi:hypothetical protein